MVGTVFVADVVVVKGISVKVWAEEVPLVSSVAVGKVPVTIVVVAAVKEVPVVVVGATVVVVEVGPMIDPL